MPDDDREIRTPDDALAEFRAGRITQSQARRLARSLRGSDGAYERAIDTRKDTPHA